MKRIMAMCVAVLVRGLFAETVALYDFSGGVAGEPVGDVSDLSESGYNGTGSAAAEGALVYSDDVPGKVLMPSQALTGTPLSTNWKSIEFVTSADGTKGGYVNIPNLGHKLADLGTAGDFTVECYVKVTVNRDWKDVFKFYYQADQGTYKDDTQAKLVDRIVSGGLSLGFQSDSNNPTTSRCLETNVWYHVAVVYTAPAEGAAQGAFRTYLNGTLFDTHAVTVLGRGVTEANNWFRLGGNGTASENLSGKIAAVRVTDAALAPSQFLRASSFDVDAKDRLGGVLGLWTMGEGTAGEPIVETPNAIDAADVLVGAGVPYVQSYVRQCDGIAPVYSDDVPGDRILSGSTNRAVIAEGIKSAKFSASSTVFYDTGSLRMTDFRSRVAGAGAFTLEYFVKYDEAYTWRNVFAAYLSSTISLKMCNTSGIGSFGYQYFPGGSTCTVNVSPNLTEGWHHVALEWDAQTKKMVVYVDYVKCSYETSDVECEDSPADACFGCERGGGANEGLNGKIACIRLTPRRLEPVDMMVVANGGDYDDKTLFHWSFEDADAADGATIAAAGAGPVNASGYRGAVSFSNSKNATYAAEVYKPTAAYVRQGRDLLSANRFSAYFYGYSKTYDNVWAGSQLRMNSTSDMNVRPESFTVEMFVRRDVAANEGMRLGTNGELLMSFGGQNINTSLENTDISFVTVDNSAGAKSLYLYYYDKSGTRSGLSIPRNLEDGVWHHLAVTYDETTRVLGVCLDYKSIASTIVEGSLRRTTDKNWSWTFGRGANSSGFVGWMDDIRVSTVARPPEEFLRHGNAPAGLMLLFR